MLKILAAPVLGAVIGYCTNWLAVKMLFRPRTEKHIGKFRLPFTPGVVPKGKERLAAAVSDVINEDLITKEALEDKLLAPEITFMVRSSVNERLALIKNDGSKTVGSMIEEAVKLSGSLKEAAEPGMSEDDDNYPEIPGPAGREEDAPAYTGALEEIKGSTDDDLPGIDLSAGLQALSGLSVYEEPEISRRMKRLKDQVKDHLTEHIYEKVRSAGLGEMAASAVNKKLSEAMAGSFLIQMMGDSLLQDIGTAIARTVDGYIAENGEELIRKMVSEETEAFMDMSAGHLIEKAEEAGLDAGEKTAQLYTAIIKKHSGDILRLIDAGGIAASAIRNMENEQLEKLVLTTMKTELGAVVSLGALIGFVLGLLNMLIYLI